MLTLVLKKEWFDKIKSGEKTHEYRKYDFWAPRIFKKYEKAISENRPLKICFKLGYNIRPNQKQERIMYAVVKKISVLWVDNYKTDNVSAPCIDIEFELIKSNTEDKCKYCSVEAQAMVHRCPECTYNPELLSKENFPLNAYRFGGLDLSSELNYKKAAQLLMDPTSDLLQELKFAKYIRNNNEGR